MLAIIEQAASDLSRAEQRVARWVLAHPRQAASTTLAEVARESGTSEPTVIRFCRSIGLGGFREFSRRLTESLSQPASYVHRDVGPDDAADDAVMKVFDASIQALIDIRGKLSTMPISAAVEVMSGARQIAFAGIGASGHVASDACHKFFRLGIPCSALTDSTMILQFAAIAGPDDVFVMLSHTGRWVELVPALELARDRGTSVICITDPASPLALKGCLVFGVDAIEDTSVYTPMSSRLGQLALLDAIHVALALEQGEHAAAKLRLSKQALRDL